MTTLEVPNLKLPTSCAQESSWKSVVEERAPRVLLVEDDPRCSAALLAWLRHGGFQVCSARDGRVGLDLVAVEAPDVVLLDLGLPRMNGFMVMNEIRNGAAATRVVVITGSSDDRTERRARVLGAAGVLRKPLDPRTLVPTLRGLLP